MNENDLDVIVVGAGIAGLTAARHLAKHQKKVCVLEARNRIGGRIFTRKTPSGKTIELGAQWVGISQPRILSLLSEFSINTTPGLAQGNNLLFLDNKLTAYNEIIPDVSFFPFLDLYLNLFRLERDCLNVPMKTPFSAKYAEEWDGMTVKTWANLHFHTPQVHKLLELFMESVFGVNSNNMSFLYFLATLHSSHGPIYNIEGSNALFVEGGLTQVCDRIAEELQDRIILNSPVIKISQTQSKVTVETMTQSYTARKVIVAVPPPLANQISYDPPLPAIRDKLHQRMPMGSVIKCFAIYKKPFWKERGFSGKIINDTGIVHQVYDVSPPDDSYGALLAFLLGSSVLHIDKISESWLADTVIASLAHFFGEEAKEPDEFVFYNWNADPWTRGGYSAYMPPGVLTELGKTLLEPTRNIYWASSEMTFEYNGYMEGAIESGLRAADLILNPSE